MDKIKKYINLPYKMEIEPDVEEGGFVISFPELPGCITCADTIERALINAADAKKCWLEAAIEDGLSIPEPNANKKYSGQFKLRLPKQLHKSLAEHSAQEGVSMNQYCVYLLSKNDTAQQLKAVN